MAAIGIVEWGNDKGCEANIQYVTSHHSMKPANQGRAHVANSLVWNLMVLGYNRYSVLCMAGDLLPQEEYSAEERYFSEQCV